MTSIDEYVSEVGRGMRGMDRRVREDVLKELRSHLNDAVADGGELVAANLEPPRATAARYKDLYGYGLPFKVIFVAIAATLGVLTVPLFGLEERAETLVSLGLLVALVAYLLWMGVKAGSGVGLAMGVAACAARLASLVAAQAIVAIAPVTDLRGWALFVAVSTLLIPLGYLPGRAKERWRPHELTM